MTTLVYAGKGCQRQTNLLPVEKLTELRDPDSWIDPPYQLSQPRVSRVFEPWRRPSCSAPTIERAFSLPGQSYSVGPYPV